MRCLSSQQFPFLWNELKVTLSEAMTAESYSEMLKSNPSDLEAWITGRKWPAKEHGQICVLQINNLEKGSSQVFSHSLHERDLEIGRLRRESEKLKRDHALTTGVMSLGLGRSMKLFGTGS